ncbi:streptomycin biosynthesis enzyme StrG [Paenibacillus arenosi]|uniref:Streptomycin biosynthesis enzyme StrG n=1 Tax=Paenibacillus arenosi TaxID=2774142 RepID=A0ABR9AT85_9BACL|nr:streptomycin biosynthesis enzyme StrG [Paenibacillus arenosi]MBD8497324.1 streptomycin biosynthesis enzyme StrG [Paenibacillus arenosi]
MNALNATQSAEIRANAAAAGPKPIKPWTILRYDTDRFPFAKIISRDVYKVKQLDLLHEFVKSKRKLLGMSDHLTQKDNLSAIALFQKSTKESPFYLFYHHFMQKVLSPLVGSSLSYSSLPNMRVHFPGTDSVSSFHHDIVATRRMDQMNCWMPFTDAEGTATLWLESDYGRGDYAPVPVQYGEALIFDGGYLGHGSVPNQSNGTRISLDMRFSYKGANTRIEGVTLLNQIVQRNESGYGFKRMYR